MKLWYSTASPYVRKVSTTIAHHNLQGQVELLQTKASANPNSPHNKDNPLGRIPALQTEQGWLFNSYLIASYLDSIGKNSSLFPQNEQYWSMLNLHSIADGILENTSPMLIERLSRPETEWWTSRHQQLTERNIRSFNYLEQQLKPFGYEFNIGTITAVCLIDWWLIREQTLGIKLAENAPHLISWATEMNQRYPTLCSTKPYIAV